MSLHPDFSPNVFHPFYFVRKGLRDNVKKLASHLSGKLMDFGCGSKPYRSFFTVDEYIGVDFENEGHPHDNEQIDVFYDGQNLPFANNYFDCILCSEVFEHVYNLNHVVNEMNRVLKTDGKILITCPFVWNEHEIPFDYARYTRFALKDILEKNGFEILMYNKSGNYITATAQLITLYFFTIFRGRWRKIFLLRWLYKFTFFLIPNLLGIMLYRLLPHNETLYLNNILLARKIKNNERQ